MQKLHLVKCKNLGLVKTNHLKVLHTFLYPEALVQRRSVKKAFLEISQNSQENTCARDSFLIKLQALSLQLY